MARRTPTADQREQAEARRRETVVELHQQLAEGVGSLHEGQAWQDWLEIAGRFHRYSFQNTMLIMRQKPDATAVAGYRAWQKLGHQVRKGEQSIKILGPVHRRLQVVDRITGQPILDDHGQPQWRRQMVGVKPVSVFDASQVDPPPPQPPTPVLLQGEAPAGLWDSLATLVADQGYTLTRGNCHGANGFTDFHSREVRVRDDVSDAQAVKTLAHELGHVLLPPAPGEPLTGHCRGLREVEAESVAYMVTQAHGLDSAQYTFNYVAGWAGEATQAGVGIGDVVAATGARVIGAVDQILRRTQPDDLEARIVDAHADSLGIGQDAPSAPTPSWETVKPAVPAASHHQVSVPERQATLSW